jgi:hypothetical protein
MLEAFSVVKSGNCKDHDEYIRKTSITSTFAEVIKALPALVQEFNSKGTRPAQPIQTVTPEIM